MQIIWDQGFLIKIDHKSRNLAMPVRKMFISGISQAGSNGQNWEAKK